MNERRYEENNVISINRHRHGHAQKRHRRPIEPRKLVMLILLVLAIIGAGVGAILMFKGISIAASKRMMPFTASSSHAYTGDGFLYVRDSELNYMSLKDEGKNYSVPITDPTARLMGTGGIKIVYNSRALQVLGTQYDIDMSGEIVKLCCGGSYVAIYIRFDDGTSILRAYDSAGGQCFELDLTDTVLTDFGFEGGDSAFLWTSQLITSGNSVTTTITVYDLNRSSVTGVISVQGRIVKDVFITGSSIFAVCTDNIIRYDRSTNSEAYRLLTHGYECVSCSFSGGRALFVLRPENGGEVVRLLSVSEKDIADERSAHLVLPEDTLYYCAMNGRLAAVTARSLILYGSNGSQLRRFEFDRTATDVERLDERNILIMYGEEAILYTIK